MSASARQQIGKNTSDHFDIPQDTISTTSSRHPQTYPTAPTVAPTWAPTAPTDAPTDAPISPMEAPIAPTDAPTELMMLLGKKDDEVDDSAVWGESVSGGPPLPAECGPPEPPLSSDGVLFRNRPVPKSTR